jgi:polyhydroxyalkanoate synthase subunit PhaC
MSTNTKTGSARRPAAAKSANATGRPTRKKAPVQPVVTPVTPAAPSEAVAPQPETVPPQPEAVTAPAVASADAEADEEEFVGFGFSAALTTLRAVAQRALREQGALLQNLPGTVGELFRVSQGSAEIAPGKGDKRFTDPAWQSNRFYHRLMQAYLYLGSRLDDAVDGLELEGDAAGRARFAAGLIKDALAPTNLLLTNPAALRLAVGTRGASLRSGAGNLISDIRHNHGMPAQVDLSEFTVGKNLAITPGAVIYRSEVCEVIQYKSQSAVVHRRPLLIVPPQVNKYYALDLAPGRSMCEHLLRQGFQVFGISWKNPTAEQRDWDVDTYAQAVLDSIEVVREVSGSPDVNLMGGCLGGMMVAIVAAILAARGDTRVHSVTMGVTLLDLDVDARILLFATPRTLAAAKRASAVTGVIEGWQMAEIFAWLRPNDLVWNYWVNNYLMGRKPPAFDILAWNADATRLSAGFHHQVLDIVAGNKLAHPGALTVLGTAVDLSAIRCDSFVVGGRTDHITPWQGCYQATQMLSGNSQFVLCSSGHIQTVVAAPGHPRLGYFTNPQTPADPEAWLAGAQRHDGSWWDDWARWLAPRSGDTRPAPEQVGSSTHPAAEAAPGTYVFL